MGKDLVDLTFYRENAEEPWGFRLAGGKDYGQPLSISQVFTRNAGVVKFTGSSGLSDNNSDDSNILTLVRSQYGFKC